MPVSKKRKNVRKVAKQYRFVTFTSELFEDDFTFPDQEHFSVGLIEAINVGDMGALTSWLAGAGVEPDQIDAFRSLEKTEVEDFLKAWGAGSLANLPKS